MIVGPVSQVPAVRGGVYYVVFDQTERAWEIMSAAKAVYTPSRSDAEFFGVEYLPPPALPCVEAEPLYPLGYYSVSGWEPPVYVWISNTGKHLAYARRVDDLVALSEAVLKDPNDKFNISLAQATACGRKALVYKGGKTVEVKQEYIPFDKFAEVVDES